GDPAVGYPIGLVVVHPVEVHVSVGPDQPATITLPGLVSGPRWPVPAPIVEVGPPPMAGLPGGFAASGSNALGLRVHLPPPVQRVPESSTESQPWYIPLFGPTANETTSSATTWPAPGSVVPTGGQLEAGFKKPSIFWTDDSAAAVPSVRRPSRAAAIWLWVALGLAAIVGSAFFVTGTGPFAPSSALVGSSSTPGASPAASLTATTGLTLNGGQAITSTVAFTNPSGGCAGFTAGMTSPTTIDTLNGNLTLGFSSIDSELMAGRVDQSGGFTVGSPGGALSANGVVGPTQIGGTLQVVRSGCTETLGFRAPISASGGSSSARPAQSQAAPPPFVIIAGNEISFGQAAGFDPVKLCKSGGTVTFTFRFAGIAAGTDVAVHLAGPGVPSSLGGTGTLSFTASSNVAVARSFPIPPGGGHWSDDIASIAGALPPSSGAHASTVVQC
ncbi:MAG: hypothetical protein ACHQNA_13245, partial [Acidimicrobiales bacterium]